MSLSRSTLSHGQSSTLLGYSGKLMAAGVLALSLVASLGIAPGHAETKLQTADPLQTTAPTAEGLEPAPVPAAEELVPLEAEDVDPADPAGPADPATSPSMAADPSVPAPETAAPETIQPTDEADTIPDIVGAGAFMGQGAAKEALGIESSGPIAMSELIDKSGSSKIASPLASPAGVQGMDVSGWQADAATYSKTQVNWSTQWSMGARFVYAKATEGNNFVDASRTSHLAGAKAVGMLHGAYHFALPDQSSAASQADHFVDNGGKWTANGSTLLQPW